MSKSIEWVIRICILSLGLSTALPLMADGALRPPQRWPVPLEPISQPDLSAAERPLISALQQARADLSQLLASADASAGAAGNAYGRLGAYYQVLGVIAPALQCYRNAVALAPDNFRWHYYAGELLLANGRSSEALGYFRRARELDPDYQALQLKLGRAHYELNHYPEAKVFFERALQTQGLAASAAYYLGQIALLERDFVSAVAYLQRALSLEPDADRLHYPLAQALRGAGDAPAARRHLALHGERLPNADDPILGELKALDSGARPHFKRAMDAVERQDYQAAAAAFAAGLALDPANASARVSLGRALYLDGREAEARTQWQQVLDASPKHPMAAFFIALLADQAADTERAKVLYERALAGDPTHAGAHFFLAGLLFRQAAFEQAASHYRAAAQSNVDIPMARLLWLLSLARGDTPDSVVLGHLERLLKARPDDAMLQHMMARLLLFSRNSTLRDARRALQLAQRAAEQVAAPANLELLALARAANGDFEGAWEVFRQVDFIPPWISGVNSGRLKGWLEVYQDGGEPELVWFDQSALLQPPPLRVDAPMREYPAMIPY